jgi:hypothetical protein
VSALGELAGQVNAVAEQVDFGAVNLMKENMSTIHMTLQSMIGDTPHMEQVQGVAAMAIDSADKAIEGLAALQEAIRETANAIVSGGAG